MCDLLHLLRFSRIATRYYYYSRHYDRDDVKHNDNASIAYYAVMQLQYMLEKALEIAKSRTEACFLFL